MGVFNFIFNKMWGVTFNLLISNTDSKFHAPLMIFQVTEITGVSLVWKIHPSNKTGHDKKERKIIIKSLTIQPKNVGNKDFFFSSQSEAGWANRRDV